MKKIIYTFFPVLLISSVHAQVVTHKVLVDRQASSTLASVDITDKLQIKVSPGSCYCCDMLDDSSGGFSSNVQIDDSSGTSNVTGQLQGVTDSKTLSNFKRVCFTVPSTSSGSSITATLDFFFSLTQTNLPVSCTETTLYGGFNTSVTDFNFLEISNTLDNSSSSGADFDVNGVITATNIVPEPDQVVINQLPFTVSAGGRVDVDIHSRTGFGAFGPVKICHNSSPGSLKAVLNQYNTVTTVPFKIEPVAQEVFQTRSATAGGSR